MKKFAFRLQKVMELRKWRERTAQQRLAEAQADRIQARTELRSALDRINAHNENRRKKTHGIFTAGDALTDSQYSRRLIRDASRRAEKVQLNEKNVTRCREELVDKSRAKKVLEKLHDRKFSEYRTAVAHEEQLDMDDDAVRRHHNERIDLD